VLEHGDSLVAVRSLGHSMVSWACYDSCLCTNATQHQAMMLLSENLNKGTEQLTVVGQFGKTKDKIFE